MKSLFQSSLTSLNLAAAASGVGFSVITTVPNTIVTLYHEVSKHLLIESIYHWIIDHRSSPSQCITMHCRTLPRSDQRHQIWSNFQMFYMFRMQCCITEQQQAEEGLERTLQSWTPATIFHRLNLRNRFPAVFNLVFDIAGITFTRLFLDQDALKCILTPVRNIPNSNSSQNPLTLDWALTCHGTSRWDDRPSPLLYNWYTVDLYVGIAIICIQRQKEEERKQGVHREEKRTKGFIW